LDSVKDASGIGSRDGDFLWGDGERVSFPERIVPIDFEFDGGRDECEAEPIIYETRSQSRRFLNSLRKEFCLISEVVGVADGGSLGDAELPILNTFLEWLRNDGEIVRE